MCWLNSGHTHPFDRFLEQIMDIERALIPAGASRPAGDSL
jgi:hypothetical protein